MPNNKKRGASLVGLKFGMLMVDSVSPRAPNNGNRYFKCLCDCGKWRVVVRDRLVEYNGPRSCGCTPHAEAGDRAPYPIPIPNNKPGARVVLPRMNHTGEEHYLAQAASFATMFSPRGDPRDCTVILERELTAAIPTYRLRITCHADGKVASLTDQTVRRLFRLMSEKLQRERGVR